MNELINKVQEHVFKLTTNDKSGHGNDHVLRVYNLAIDFAEKEGANKEIVAIAALLHDVDDYKMVGKENSEKLINARKIMGSLNISEELQEQVLNIIKAMGYSNYLKGIRPTTLEGKIISDADMCDGIGSSGIIRSVVYAVSDKGNGRIFDKDIMPNVNITIEEYNGNGTNTTHDIDSAINHFFEKLLKLSNLMMTSSGKEEATERQEIMIDFLRHFFKEENVPEWNEFLNKYLEENIR